MEFDSGHTEITLTEFTLLETKNQTKIMSKSDIQ